MKIPAAAFTTLPEDCPVLVGAVTGIVVRQHSAREWKVWTGTNRATGVSAHIVVDKSMLWVDLTTEVEVRAFVPALICAVRYPENRTSNDTRHPPQPLWDSARGVYTLFSHILDSGAVCACMPQHELVTGTTPEEALLNGLKAALNAANPRWAEIQ